MVIKALNDVKKTPEQKSKKTNFSKKKKQNGGSGITQRQVHKSDKIKRLRI